MAEKPPTQTGQNQKKTKKATFKVGRQAKKDLQKSLATAKNPVETIKQFQQTHSLHTFTANAFGTTPLHEFGSSGKNITGKRTTRGETNERQIKARDGIVLEPFQPESVLTFLGHLGVTRYDVHKLISDRLRAALEDEIEKVDLASSSSGKEDLLELLTSAWRFNTEPDLRPVLIALVKKLGDQTPKEVLTELARRDKKSGELQYVELLQQFGLNMRQLVWEADWASVVQGDGMPIAASSGDMGSLKSNRVLVEMVRPAVEEYMMDDRLKNVVELMFSGTIREKKFATQSRRSIMRSNNNNNNEMSSSTGHSIAFNALSTSSSSAVTSTSDSTKGQGTKGSVAEGSKTTEENKASSGNALSKIKEIMGSRPKLLAAILNMLISQHGGDGLNAMVSGATPGQGADDSSMGYASNLGCTLVADILLSYGQLPRPYEHVHILATLLDKSVKIGLVSDQAIAQIQGCLKEIFQPTQEKEKKDSTTTPPASAVKSATPSSRKKTPIASKGKVNTKIDTAAEQQFELKLIRKIVEEAVIKMKESDPRGLFLNHVTDQIAPGYSRVIKKPMCIRNIEHKAVNQDYSSLEKYKADVDLMFENCIKYNIGPEGEWYRGEANRQHKAWKDDCWKKAKAMYSSEMKARKEVLQKATDVSVAEEKKAARVSKESNEKKRKQEIMMAQRERLTKLSGEKHVKKKVKIDANDNADDAINQLDADDVDPLPNSRVKKRKKDISFPSMPALASMLLSDPFVVRILLDKLLRASKEVVQTKNVPCSHKTIPSVLQILHLSQFSIQLCAVKGKKFIIPDAGLSMVSKSEEESSDDPIANIPFSSLRKFTPLYTQLLLQLELDQRISVGGDLHYAKDALPVRPPPDASEWKDASFFSVYFALIQGTLVNLLQPGKATEASLLLQIPRLTAAIDQFVGGNMRNERHFYVSLTEALLKHKAKLSHPIRDLIVKSWLKWFQSSDSMSCMCSAVHECFMHLITEWASLGNKIMPRDTHLSLAEEAAKTAEASGRGKTVTFVSIWKSEVKEFYPVKSYYERMLSGIPEARALKWKEAVGIDENEQMVIDG